GPAPGREEPLAHLEELTCPCCIPALGEFSEVPPHEGSVVQCRRPATGGPKRARPASPPEPERSPVRLTAGTCSCSGEEPAAGAGCRCRSEVRTVTTSTQPPGQRDPDPGVQDGDRT